MDNKEIALAAQNAVLEKAISSLCAARSVDASRISMRSLRPDDISKFDAGTSGTDKTMGEHDYSVAAGSTINVLSDEVPTNEVLVITGMRLQAATGLYCDYVDIFIGDSKQRQYNGQRITAEENETMYFDDPLIVNSGETIKFKIMTSTNGTLPIEVLGKVLKVQA